MRRPVNTGANVFFRFCDNMYKANSIVNKNLFSSRALLQFCASLKKYRRLILCLVH